ncbi:AraC family transcriptional regulator [Vallitalea okinawensis]|uniref:AraC family transcriptional regulator n=1 Tax=Vallitalea okinawensis TaxID=2078660 RepID=UPI000CFBB823|nr:AraC family transcriptional regulator [Vallitalea okinawensis]
MKEAYFEELIIEKDKINYPFSSFITESTEMSEVLVRPHWHNYIELLYFKSGHSSIFLSGKEYQVSPGDLIIINSNEVHSIFATEQEESKYIVIKFDPELLHTSKKTIFEMKYILPFTINNFSHQKLFKLYELNSSPIQQLVEEIYDEFINKPYGFELAIRINISRIFLWILRNWNYKGITMDNIDFTNEREVQKLQYIFDYVDHHYFEDISTKKIAQLSGMSCSYFCRHFKKITHTTFTDYLNYVRISEAEKLLSTTDMNVTEVAITCGFSNSSYFIKQFKKYKGITPKKFKLKLPYQ